MAPLKVGFAGYGNSARVFHLPYVLGNPNDFEVIAFLQPSAAPPAGTKPAKPHCTIDFPQAKHYRDPDEFFADKEIDLVLIVTGHAHHASLAKKSLLAGKNAVVEKPFTVTSAEADELLDVMKQTGKTLYPFQNRRYDSDYQTVQGLVERKAFGDIVEFEVHYDIDLPSWMAGMGGGEYQEGSGSGLMFGIGVHKFDQVLHLFGRPATITSFPRALRPKGAGSDIEDSFTVILTYDKSGPHKNLVVTVKTNVITKMDQLFAYFVRGYDGSFIKFGDDRQENQVQAGMKVTNPDFGMEPKEMWGTLTTVKKVDDCQTQKGDRWVGNLPSVKGDYGRYYADVARAIRGEIEPVVKAQTSRDGIRMCELARKSAETGRSVDFE